MRYRIEIPAGRGAEAVREFVDHWSQNERLRALVEGQGGEWPLSDSTLDRLEQLYVFSEVWDFRRGSERLDISQTDIRVPQATIEEAAHDLGMSVSAHPTDGRYDHALVLGGTALASYCRTKLVSELLADGLDLGRVASLGALRIIPDQEKEIARERPDIVGAENLDPDTEFDVLLEAAKRFLPTAAEVARELHDDPNEHLRSARAQYVTGDGIEVEVIAAPSPDPDRRATTIDNYQSYIERVAPGESVLISTSAIYTPYHFFVALRALRWSQALTVEVVGFPPEWMRGVLTAPHNYLQETRSAIFGALTLARDLDGFD